MVNFKLKNEVLFSLDIGGRNHGLSIGEKVGYKGENYKIEDIYTNYKYVPPGMGCGGVKRGEIIIMLGENK